MTAVSVGFYKRLSDQWRVKICA